MALILNLETATTVCSVSLGKDGKSIASREINNGYTHAENLTLFIDEVLKAAGLAFSDIDAVAVSKGPGSYTGLRIGVSVAKGLCYALDKPLIGVETLKNLTLALSKGEGNLTEKLDSPRFFTSGKSDWNNLLPYAKDHRKNPTEAEGIMWENLRNRRLGYKFRRQHPIGKFIADFVCIEKKLIVEIDGDIHNHQKEADKIRTDFLRKQGFKVIRFANEEVVSNVNEVLRHIEEELNNPQIVSSLSIGEGRGEVSSLSKEEGRGEVLFCPMLDARRMEVYCAVYDSNFKEIKPTSAEIITENSFSDLLATNKIIFFGDGAEKCRSKITHSNAMFIADIMPSSISMCGLSEKLFNENNFEDLAYFEPFYLKDFVGVTKESK